VRRSIVSIVVPNAVAAAISYTTCDCFCFPLRKCRMVLEHPSVGLVK
jgi:hypothetical protein